MSARRDPFFLPAKKKPRTAAGGDAETAEEPKAKAGGFRALLEAQPEGRAGADGAVPADENADEKRIRLAKQYLEQVRDDLGGSAAEPERIASVLFSETQKSIRAFRFVGARVEVPAAVPAVVRAQREAITAVAVSADGQYAYAASKDGTVAKFYVPAAARVATYAKSTHRTGRGQAHTARVLALALTTDGRVLAAGGEDRAIHLWDTERDARIDTLAGHRDAVTALAFRANTRQLFSAGRDRTVKVWNADSLAYVEALFGHQADVLALASLDRERVVSVGADSTCRVWKIVEQSQLVFHGHRAAIEAVALLNDNIWVAGGQDGAVSLWLASKRAPVDFRPRAHGGRWITAVAACPRTDLIATGSSDGFVRLWSLARTGGAGASSASSARPGARSAAQTTGLPKLQLQKAIPITGFVNGLAFSASGELLVVGVGKEHRLGRWETIAGARNGVVFVPLSFRATDDAADD